MVGESEFAALEAAAENADFPAFQRAAADLWARVGEAADVLERIVPLFAKVPPAVSGQLAVGAVLRYRRGAPEHGLVAAVADGLRRALEDAAAFADAWPKAAGRNAAFPAPGDGNDQEWFEYAAATLSRERRWPRRALPADEAARYAGAWMMLDDWMTAATGLLELREVRVAFPHREKVARLARQLDPLRRDMFCLIGLLDMLDDEPLIVVDRAGKRAFRLRISGVGDNFQLHTLIADVLSREGLVEGIRPEPEWVAAAATGAPDGADRTRALFQLTDGDGMAVPIDGRPALIPLHRGRRVVVMDPCAYGRSWDLGRSFDVVPEVRLEEVLGPEVARSVAGPISEPGPARSHVHHERETGRVATFYQG
ncbi:hypothetical protein ACFQS1_02830 [Paractinoplanes rhizophilus]|uniref:Uncharacterized protein n=1 Tax=Paractinoplanes rhizophilus TaxID=1416877 RepID=A0ABW2HI93_9ACTN